MQNTICFFIFFPIQLLSVWTTISGAVFAYHISRDTPTTVTLSETGDSTSGDEPIYTSGSAVDEEDISPLWELRSMIDALVGASLLILTNLSNVLQKDYKSKQHNLLSGQMDDLLELVDFVVEKGGKDECFDSIKEIESNFKQTISNNKLSPPSEIKLAFDILQSELEWKLKTKEEASSYDPMGDYSLLASFIESRINLCALLPNSRESTIVINSIVENFSLSKR
jgi:hypothetical protein